MSEEIEAKTFWLDGFEGSTVGGYFIRNPLKEFFKTLEDKGLKPVGIVVDDSYNMEIIVEGGVNE